MSRAAYVACAIAALAVAAPAVLAKGPKPTEMPTVEEIYQQAKQALDSGGKSGERPHDPVQDTIDLYKDKTKTPLTEYQPLVDLINNPKETAQHRQSAADAIVLRFLGEDQGNADIKAQRRAIANGVLDLMKVDEKKDPAGLEVVDWLLNKWWRSVLQVQAKWVKSGPQADRRKAYEKMKKFLKSEN